MPKPYDSALRTLVALTPDALPRLLDSGGLSFSALDADASIVSSAMDAAIRVETIDGPFVLHLEFQASHDVRLLSRAAMYAGIYHHKTGMFVRTVIVFLRPAAWRSDYASGVYVTRHGEHERPMCQFGILKAWELPRTALLGHPGLAPMAVLTRFGRQDYAEILEQLDQVLSDHPHRKDLLAISHVLAGLREDGLELAEALQARFPAMEESKSYQMMREKYMREGIREGRVIGEDAGMHLAIRELAAHRLGEPDSATLDALTEIHDRGRLKRLLLAAPHVSSWMELLGTP